MKKFCIFGNPVAHSKSPQMQNAGFKYLNLDASYEKFHLENGDNIKKEFIKNSYNCYKISYRNNWLEDITKHFCEQ